MRLTVFAPDVLRALIPVVTLTTNREDATVLLQVDGAEAHVVALDAAGRVRSAAPIPVHLTPDDTPVHGAWRLSAAALRDACRNSRGGIVPDAGLGFEWSAADQAFHTVAAAHRTSVTVRATPVPSVPLHWTAAPVLGFDLTPADWQQLATFAGPDGTVRLEPEAGRAVAVRPTGAAIEVRFPPVAAPVTEALPPRPVSAWHAEAPGVRPRRTVADERQLAMFSAADLDAMATTPATPPATAPVHLTGQAAHGIAYTLNAEWQQHREAVRADNKVRRARGEPVSEAEGRQRLDAGRPLARLSVEDATGDRVVEAGRVTARVAMGPIVDAPAIVEVSPKQAVAVAVAELRALLEWAMEGERVYAAIEPAPEALITIGQGRDGVIRVTGHRAWPTGDLADRTRTIAIEASVSDDALAVASGAATVRDLYQVIAPLRPQGQVRLAGTASGGLAVRLPRTQATFPPPPAPSHWQPLFEQCTVTTLARATSTTLVASDDADIAALFAEETERGVHAPAIGPWSDRTRGDRMRDDPEDALLATHLDQIAGPDWREMRLTDTDRESLCRTVAMGRDARAEVTRRLADAADGQTFRPVPPTDDRPFSAVPGASLQRIIDAGDAARDTLMRGHLAFVMQLAVHMRSRLPLTDRFSIASHAFLKAIDGWMPGKTGSLLSYARTVVGTEAVDSLPIFGEYPVSYSEYDVMRPVLEQARALEQSLGRSPTSREIAVALGRLPRPEDVAAGRAEAPSVDAQVSALRVVDTVRRLVSALRAPSWDDLARARDGGPAHLTTLGDLVPAVDDGDREPPTAPLGRTATLARLLARTAPDAAAPLAAAAGLGGAFQLSDHEFALATGLTIDTVQDRVAEGEAALQRSLAAIFPRQGMSR